MENPQCVFVECCVNLQRHLFWGDSLLFAKIRTKSMDQEQNVCHLNTAPNGTRCHRPCTNRQEQQLLAKKSGSITTSVIVNMTILLSYSTSVEFAFTVENFPCPWHGTSKPVLVLTSHLQKQTG